MLIAGSMKCPYCRKAIDMSAMRNREILRCPYCQTRIIASQLGVAGYIALMERGMQAMRDGRWLDAQKTFEESTRKNPYSYESWFWRGVIACQFRNWDDARRFFSQASYSRTETMRILTQTLRDWHIMGDLLRLATSAEMAGERDIARIFYDVVFTIDPSQKRIVALRYINVAAAFAASGKDDPEELENLASGLAWASELDAGSAGQAASMYITFAHLTPDFAQAERFLEKAYEIDPHKRARVAGELHLGAPDRMRHGAPTIDSEHRTGYGGLAERLLLDTARKAVEEQDFNPDWASIIKQVLRYARRSIEIDPQPSRRIWVLRALFEAIESIASVGFQDIALEMLDALQDLMQDYVVLPVVEQPYYSFQQEEDGTQAIAEDEQQPDEQENDYDPMISRLVLLLARIAEAATADERFDLGAYALERADRLAVKLGVAPPLHLVNTGRGGLPMLTSLLSVLHRSEEEKTEVHDERVDAVCRLGSAWLCLGLLAKRKGNDSLATLCASRAVPLLGRPPASVRMCDALLDAAEAGIDRYVSQRRAIRAAENHPYAGPQKPILHKTPDGATPDLLVASAYLTLTHAHFPRSRRLHQVADRIGWTPKR